MDWVSLEVFWLLGYGSTPFMYPRVTLITYFLIMFFFCAVLSVSASEHICTYYKKQVTVVTLYEVPTFYLRWHGSKYLEFHENSLPMNLPQATIASLVPRRRGKNINVSPLPLPHLFHRNAIRNLYQRRPKRPRPPPLLRPPRCCWEYSRDIISPLGKSSGTTLGDTYIWRGGPPRPSPW